MAEIITNPQVARTYLEQKQTNEQQLLQDLNRLFDNWTSYNKVRHVVLRGLGRMLVESGSPAFTGALGDPLSVWTKVPAGATRQGIYWLASMMAAETAEARVFNINDLSELLRVIGIFFEKAGGFGGYKDINLAYRPGVASPDSGTQPWSLGRVESEFQRTWKRLRQRPPKATVVPPGGVFPIEPHIAPNWVSPPPGFTSGMQLFRAHNDDLTKKIDLVFGLQIGATISGTTSDTVMGLEVFGSDILQPSYYLFPVATLAASLHHTLVEAGLALTLNKIIDYRIGFYSTLLPKGALPSELSRLTNILTAKEIAATNRKAMFWYDTNPAMPAGCVIWNRPYELTHFKNKLADSKSMLTHIEQLPSVPKAVDVGDFISRLSPELGTSLPSSMRRTVRLSL